MRPDGELILVGTNFNNIGTVGFAKVTGNNFQGFS
jgi:hypothetical protein